jgi:hypothetical protein
LKIPANRHRICMIYVATNKELAKIHYSSKKVFYPLK